MATKNSTTPRLCTWQGCERIHRAKGFCLLHYKRIHRKSRNMSGPVAFALPSWVKESDLAYAAGFIDADGTIGINVGKAATTVSGLQFNTQVSAVCVDREPIEFLLSIFGGTFGTRQARSGNLKGRLPIHQWSVASDRAAWVADLLHPFLRIKKRQAIAVRDFKREALWKQNATEQNRMPQSELDRRMALASITRYRNQRKYLIEKNPEV